MPKTLKTEPKKVGRKSKYDPSRLDDVERFCLLGATDEQLADFLEIDISNFYVWKRKYPEFREAIKKGKDLADINVADSLYNRALEGDTTAMIFWLKNRRREHWRDKQDIKHEGSVTYEVVTNVPRSPDDPKND